MPRTSPNQNRSILALALAYISTLATQVRDAQGSHYRIQILSQTLVSGNAAEVRVLEDTRFHMTCKPLSAMTPPYGKRQTIILRGDPEWSIHAPGQYIDVGRTYLCATVLLYLVAGSAFPGTTPAESAVRSRMICCRYV